MLFRPIAVLAASISVASAIRGFNTGNLLLDGGTPKQESDFAAEFTNQQKITGTDGAFTAARLYTMIQAGTTSSPISAIPAAIQSHTKLLLGLWASAGQSNFDLELAALKSAIQQYGSAFTSLVTGISVGSEDLYRLTPTSIQQDGGDGASPETIANYIGQVKELIQGTSLSATPVGHVDTWTAWVQKNNSAAIDASDFVGMNTFPYFQTTDSNPIKEAGDLFYKALADTRGAAGGKPVWVTETGYPRAGPISGEAVASPTNAESYWDQVYCTLPEDVVLFWYTQRDANAGDKATFGVTGQTLSTTPEYDLSCKAVVSSSSSSSASHPATSASRSSSPTASPSAGGSAVFGGFGSLVSTTTRVSSQIEMTGHATGTQMVHAPTANAPVPGPLYPTASGLTSVPAAVGTGGTPATTSGPSAYQPNSGSIVRSTLALLAVPAMLALML